MDSNTGSERADTLSHKSAITSSGCTSPPFPITKREVADRADMQSQAVARGFDDDADRRGDHVRSHGGSSASSGYETPASSKAKALPASLQSPYPPISRPPTAERPLHVVLASTGSVASVKIPLIVEELLRYPDVRVQIIATDSSLHFYERNVISQLDATYSPVPTLPLEPYTVASLAAENLSASRLAPHPGTPLPRAHLWTNADEWSSFKRIGDPILHIELRRWADIVLVAPTSANTLAKLNAGICDDLLTSFLRALAPGTPTVLFPAMNTLMWMHPLTERQVGFAKEVLGYEVVGPIEKRLACGDLGAGAMTEWMDVVDVVVQRFGLVKKEEQVQ